MNSHIFGFYPMNSKYLYFSKSMPTLLAVAIIVIFAAVWQARVTGHFSWTASGTLGWFITLCMAYGKIALPAKSPWVGNKGGLAFQFLCGYLIFNTSLFLLAVISPLGMMANVLTLSIAAIILSAYRIPDIIGECQNSLPSLLCITISGAAATLWCSDAQTPLLMEGQTSVFRTWQDMFFHAREISAFSQYHGIGTFNDIRMSGAPAPFYHYASYLSAAAISFLSGISAVDVYSSFQLPFGIFLTGLAAFALIASIWGAWPGLAATVAIVLIPDAYQQGFANRYLGYNFMAQINLGMLYGIACIAVAWIFILDGCRRGKYPPILLGYALSLICLFYKAHLFVANSFLILIYPCLFFTGIKARWRLAAGIVFVGVFVWAVNGTQNIQGVPVLRLDGSGIAGYLKVLVEDYDPGLLKTFFNGILFEQQHSKPVNGLYVVALLLTSTLGLWAVAAAFTAILLWRRADPAAYFFPLLIIVNYLVMSIGLAADEHNAEGRYELLNRPSAWAYFAVVAWTAGGLYHFAFGDSLPRGKMARLGLSLLVCFSLAGPLVFSQNLQTFPALRGYARYEDFNAVPVCMVKAAQFIRNHSRPDEIIQASEFDPRYFVTALSERQIFANKSMFRWQIKALQDRVDALLAFNGMDDANAIKAFAAGNGIAWYLLEPASKVSWPADFLNQAAFACDGYRVYHFAP